ncbi:hypothetical protein BBBOND_0101740 [Babesia bigemina]|uniref:Uncharacterized protein n=1 Tax=Babesia bigemina TaxID=5866 RepID=A0A061D808_BABBI|nr:hypothetical protein BBBOND_0101740 [Babesia bigemina]CDR93845.1 hypothetical protein BBBOND_0101740 [Babesia bigemina]|eukprot:XP_012766031.1 hypothetical protein BBBOND_0101740 [Babesia bigemina]
MLLSPQPAESIEPPRFLSPILQSSTHGVIRLSSQQLMKLPISAYAYALAQLLVWASYCVYFYKGWILFFVASFYRALYFLGAPTLY